MTDEQSPANDVPIDPLQGSTPPDVLPPGQLVIPPLPVAALVVRKADLIVALRLFVPQLVDLAPLDSENYLLSFHLFEQNAESKESPRG